MVGTSGMRPQRIELNGAVAEGESEASEAREKIMKRFEQIGLTLMNRTRGSADFHSDPIASVLGDPYKRTLAAQILGQAYVIAYNFVAANGRRSSAWPTSSSRSARSSATSSLDLLDSQGLTAPELDYTKDETWPKM